MAFAGAGAFAGAVVFVGAVLLAGGVVDADAVLLAELEAVGVAAVLLAGAVVLVEELEELPQPARAKAPTASVGIRAFEIECFAARFARELTGRILHV